MANHDTWSIVLLAAGLMAAHWCARADVKRRRLRLNSALGTVPTGLGGTTFFAFSFFRAAEVAALLTAFAVASACIFLAARLAKASALIVADIAAASSAALIAVSLFISLLLTPTVPRPLAVAFLAATISLFFFWREGRRAMQWQRPDGIVAAEFLILVGIAELVYEVAYLHIGSASPVSFFPGLVLLATGLCLLIPLLRHYFTTREDRRIVAHLSKWGESLQPEYTPPTPECPFPQRWKMYDTMTAEVEVLEFLTSLVVTLKPNLIVETGSFAGISTVALAQGLQRNGFGRVVSCEFDGEIFAKAKERITASGLQQWIDLRNESSLEMSVDGTIDVLFSDSDQEIREREVRKFLPQMDPNGLILVHDASSHYGTVRKGALTMEREGLISVILLPTPRGLAIAQKSRNGRFHP